MTHSDSMANLDLSGYLNLALRLANLFPAVLDFETGEIGPDLWDEVVGNPPGTTPPRLEAWEAAIHPDDRPARDASWADCLAGRAPLHQAEYRVRRHDGHWVWIKVVGKVVERDAGGRPLRLALAVRNIDDLRQDEQQLRERERQLESLMGHLPGLAYRALADEHWTALFVSKGVEDLTGYPADEFTSRRLNYADIMLPEDRPATREAVFTALRERRMYEAEHRIRHKDGSVRWIWARGHGVFAPDGSLRFIEGLNLDMTRQKQAEEALRASERRFRVFVDHAADAFFLGDEKGRVLDVNRRACESLGYTRDELIGMTPFDFVDLEPTVVEDRIRQFLAGEAVAFESRHRRKDGTVFPVETRGKSFREGGRQFLVALARDVTDRKQAEERLRESEQRWRSLTEALPQLVWSATPDGACDYFSPQWTQHTGVPERDLLGWRWLAVLHPDDREPTRRLWTDSVAGRGPYDVEYRVRRSDGVVPLVQDPRHPHPRQRRPGRQVVRDLHRHLRPPADRGGAAGERGAVPRHLRERGRRHRPPAISTAASCASTRSSAPSSATPRRVAPEDRPGHHAPRRPGTPALELDGGTPAGRVARLHAGEALRPQGRLARLGGAVRLAPAGRGGQARLFHRDCPGHLGAQAAGGGAAAGEGGGGGGQPGQGRVPGQRQPRDPHPHERHPRHDRAGARHAPGRGPAAGLEDGQVGGR